MKESSTVIGGSLVVSDGSKVAFVLVFVGRGEVVYSVVN